MNDLPTPQSSGSTPPLTNTSSQFTPPASSSGSSAKEREGGGGISSIEVGGIQSVGQEVELPKEVASVGVTVQPTTVPVPPAVAQMGVKAVGPNAAPPSFPTTVALPLTDDLIAQGLHQSVTSSWRWLAEWCIRRLKQVHTSIKSVHGKIMRVHV